MDPNDRGIDDRDLIIGVDGQRVEDPIPDAGNQRRNLVWTDLHFG
jgi:hypothetical protein